MEDKKIDYVLLGVDEDGNTPVEIELDEAVAHELILKLLKSGSMTLTSKKEEAPKPKAAAPKSAAKSAYKKPISDSGKFGKTKALRERIHALRDQGKTAPKIAAMVSVPVANVSYYLKDYKRGGPVKKIKEATEVVGQRDIDIDRMITPTDFAKIKEQQAEDQMLSVIIFNFPEYTSFEVKRALECENYAEYKNR